MLNNKHPVCAPVLHGAVCYETEKTITKLKGEVELICAQVSNQKGNKTKQDKDFQVHNGKATKNKPMSKKKL